MTRSIVYVDIDNVKTAKANPKKHAIADIKLSFAQFGCTVAGIVDSRTGRLVAGHGRLKALREYRDDGEPPPEGIQVGSNGEWLAPYVEGWSSGSENASNAYLVGDNQLTIKEGWEDKELFALLDSLDDLDGTGFTLDDLDQMGKENADDKEKKSVSADWQVIVTCEDATEQMMLLETLKGQGYDAKLGKKPEN